MNLKAKDEFEKLILCFVECAKAYDAFQEMGDVLNEVIDYFESGGI